VRRTRDRRCVAPSCRRPGHGTDLGHPVDHAHGGPTLAWNLGAWCRHHHRAKHHGGWRVPQPARAGARSPPALAPATRPARRASSNRCPTRTPRVGPGRCPPTNSTTATARTTPTTSTGAAA
jgi:hypothetical protein